MSLLFDALKRVQGSTEGVDSARTILAATGNLPGVLSYARYVVPVLALLAGGAAWYFYPQDATLPHQPAMTSPVAASAVLPIAASNVAAISGVASGAALDQPGGVAAANKGKPWTQPIGAKKRSAKKRTPPQEPAKLVASTDQDPLQEGYRALSEGKLEQAEQKYLAALAQHPHEKDALLGLAVIAHRNLQIDRAAAYYRQVLREDLGNAAAAAGLVSLSAQADPALAESQLKELLDIKPTAHEFHYALGSALARQLRWGEAQQSFFRAFKLEPDNAAYAYNLAVSLDRLHQPAQALLYYEKASQLAKPDDPTLDRDVISRRIHELTQ